MFFSESKYVENSITEYQENNLMEYAECYIDFLVADKSLRKRKSELNARHVEEAKKKLIENMPQIRDIKITEQERNIYLLIAASKKKCVEILYELLGDLSSIDKLFSEWLEYHKVNKGFDVDKKNKLCKEACKHIDGMFISGKPANILKTIKLAYQWTYDEAFVAAYLQYPGKFASRNKKEPRFSYYFAKEILERIASVFINTKAEIEILVQTKGKIVASINGTVCSLEAISNREAIFKNLDKENSERVIHGEIDVLGKTKLLHCYSLFVNTIYSDNIKAKFAYSDEEKKKTLGKEDVIVKSTIRYCVYKQHNVEDVVAKVLVMTPKEVKWDYFHAAYCKECNRYYILNEDYKKIDGIPLCRVLEIRNGKEKDIKENWNVTTEYKESIIHSMGYNVNMNENLSAEYRRRILEDLIKNDIVSQEMVLSYLDSLVLRGLGSPKYKNAVEKWKSDREYIEKQWYSKKEVVVESIIRKI